MNVQDYYNLMRYAIIGYIEQGCSAEEIRQKFDRMLRDIEMDGVESLKDTISHRSAERLLGIRE